MPTESLYKLLGVTRDADPESIRKAYRALALESHPDRAGGGEGPANRFAAVARAYQVLSDPERRKDYDRSLDDWDPLSEIGRRTAASLVGRRFGRVIQAAAIGQVIAGRLLGGKPKRAGRSTRYDLSVSATDLAAAREVEIRYLRRTACPDCAGRATMDTDPCGRCEGTGRVERKQTVELALPAEASDGTRLRVTGLGEQGIRGGSDGDLVVVLRIDREGDGR